MTLGSLISFCFLFLQANTENWIPLELDQKYLIQ